MTRRALSPFIAAGFLLLAACGSDDADSAKSAQNKCKPGDKGCVEGTGNTPATHTDGIKNGTETGVDCGGSDPAAERCDVGEGCVAGTDCGSEYCAADGKCQVPSPTDNVKNGNETDIDCGGDDANTPRCDVGKTCKAHTDCKSDGCTYDGKCIARPSCAGHFGGDTCGAGEVDDADKQHESCCETAPISDADDAVQLDKYVITAGRMRQFVERFDGDLKGYIQSIGDSPNWKAEWTDRLPSNVGEVNYLLGPGDDDNPRAGCDLGASRGRTYWMSDAENDQIDVGHHGLDKDILDQKMLNCVEFYMLQALCIWDGGRLATLDEIRAAWQGGESRSYPWGADLDQSRVIWTPTADNFTNSYMYPEDGDGVSNWYFIAAPGRRPTGNGKFGHSDLAGLGFELTSQFDGAGNVFWSGSGSWEGHGITAGGAGSPTTINRAYWALTGRCAMPTQ